MKNKYNTQIEPFKKFHTVARFNNLFPIAEIFGYINLNNSNIEICDDILSHNGYYLYDILKNFYQNYYMDYPRMFYHDNNKDIVRDCIIKLNCGTEYDVKFDMYSILNLSKVELGLCKDLIIDTLDFGDYNLKNILKSYNGKYMRLIIIPTINL